MTFKDFFTKLGEAFANALLNAVGSTTFWLTIVSIILVLCKVLPWESVLVTGGIYGGNRIAQNATANLGGK